MNALFPIFQDFGVYGDVCTNSTGGCTEQIIVYANAFTTCSVVQVLLGVVLGLLIDNIGLRIMNLASTIINFIGLIMFVFLSSSTPVIIFIGSTLAGIGGTGMVMCTFSANQLFTKTASMVLTFIEGVYDTSSAVFAFVHLAYTAGFSFKASFLILSIGGLVASVLNSLFVQSYWLADMPKYKGAAVANVFDNSETNSSKVNC